jgi:hypothetical protein
MQNIVRAHHCVSLVYVIGRNAQWQCHLVALFGYTSI